MKTTDPDIEASKVKLDQFLTSFYAARRQQLSGQPAPPVAIDPQKVAAAARLYLEAEHNKGNNISTTAAVEYVMQKQRRQH